MMKTDQKGTPPATLGEVKWKPLTYFLEGTGVATILARESVRLLYVEINGAEFSREDLAEMIGRLNDHTHTLTDHTLNRLADNLLRRWKRQGLVKFLGGKFGNALWAQTLRV